MSIYLMVTCHIKYIIDPDKLEAFEHYARLWIPLVNKFGGRHHGCFLPSEGANNMALALFTEALNESILDSSERAAVKMRFPPCFKIND